MSHPILASHPYFNPDFVAQYQIQDQQYKKQQQAQLVQNLTKEAASETIQAKGGISKEVMGTTGLGNMVVSGEADSAQKVDY